MLLRRTVGKAQRNSALEGGVGCEGGKLIRTNGIWGEGEWSRETMRNGPHGSECPYRWDPQEKPL